MRIKKDRPGLGVRGLLHPSVVIGGTLVPLSGIKALNRVVLYYSKSVDKIGLKSGVSNN